MAKTKQTNVEKLVNQVAKNKGFQNIINAILDTSFIINNPAIIIDDNPGYIDKIMEIAESYELADEDIEIVSGNIVKALAKTKLLHNICEDVTRLTNAFNETLKEQDNNYPIAADIFQIIRCELSDITDEDATRSAIYISMYRALKDVFSSVSSADSNYESVEDSSEKNTSQLENLNLMGFIKPKEESKENTSNTDHGRQKLGEEVMVGGKKAHKVVKTSETPKPTTVAIAASESSKPQDDKVSEEHSELKDDKPDTESIVAEGDFDKPQAIEYINKMLDSIDTNVKDKIIDIISVDKLGDVVMSLYAIKDNDDDVEFIKVLLKFMDELSKDKQIELIKIIGKLGNMDIINPGSNIKDIIKNLASSEKNTDFKAVINDVEFEKIITSAATNDEVARRFKTKLVLDIVGGDHYAIKELYSAGYTRNIDTIKNTIINICENDQNKCDMVVEAFKEYQFTIEYLSEFSINLSPITMFGTRKFA